MGKFYKTPEANISVSTTATTLEVGAKASAQKVCLPIDLAELEEVVVYVGHTTRLLVKCRIINSCYALVDYPTFH
jgi:hypothetical protein